MDLNDIRITPLLDTLRLQKISDEEYFSEAYSNYISNSRLGLINPAQEGSPDKFFSGLKPIYSSSLDIGTAVHSLTLQKSLFNIVDSVNKPTGKMGAMAEELFKTWKGETPTDKSIKEVAKKIDYYGGNLSPKRIEEVKTKCSDFWTAKKQHLQTRGEDPRVDLYLDQKSRETSYACIRAIENNKYIQEILNPTGIIEDPISETEQAILLDIQIDLPNNKGSFILRLKSKLDHYVINKELNEIQVNDVKTLGRILSDFSINVDRYRYNREIAMYSFLLKLVAEKFYGMSNPTIKGHYLVVSTIPQFYSKVVPITYKDFLEGFKEFKYLLRLVAYHVAKNHKDFAYKWI